MGRSKDAMRFNQTSYGQGHYLAGGSDAHEAGTVSGSAGSELLNPARVEMVPTGILAAADGRPVRHRRGLAQRRLLHGARPPALRRVAPPARDVLDWLWRSAGVDDRSGLENRQPARAQRFESSPFRFC